MLQLKMDLIKLMKKNIIILFLLLVIGFLMNAHADSQYNETSKYTVTIRSVIQNASPLELQLTENEYNKYIRPINNSIFNNNGNNNNNSKNNNKDNENIKIKFSMRSGNLNSSPDKPKIYSVVQDWHLVCKQLCGAGLGGPTCGEPTCNDIKTEANKKDNITERANFLLGENTNFICQDLCKYQLGGQICTCNQPITLTNFDSKDDGPDDGPDDDGRNQICHTFCEHNDLTITGCSICSKDDDYDSLEGKTDTTTILPPNIKTSSSATITKTTKNTPKPKLSTTPNWEKICKDLCKSGDGGSLCNCDKPPFF